jgi:catechol-2,3-dioxygenase
VEFTAEHILTKSVYFFDPDGNRLEIFCEMMDPETGMEHMRQGVNLNNRSYTPEPILSA